MSDTTSNETTALTPPPEGRLAQDLDKLGEDVLNLAADIGSKLYGDAKAEMQQFIDKLPQPMPYLLQGMAGSAEAVIDSMGTQAYEHLQAREKELIEKTKKVCGTGLALVEAFFERQGQ